jgi:hypothetical protein
MYSSSTLCSSNEQVLLSSKYFNLYDGSKSNSKSIILQFLNSTSIHSGYVKFVTNDF